MNIRILLGRRAPPHDAPLPDQMHLVAARDIHEAYEINEVAAEFSYRGQHVLVNGVVAGIVRIAGAIVVNLDSGNADWPVHCVFPESEAPLVALLRKGQPVLVVGRCRSRSGHSVLLTGCRLTEATVEGAQMAG